MRMSHLLCGLLGFVLSVQPAFAKRVALVVGNSNYGAGLELKNPANDARAVAASLRALQFTVIERVDQNIEGMETALRDFGRVLQDGDVAWFFYAGHGLQVRNINYLLPVGCDVQQASELPRKAIDLEAVKTTMLDARARLNVIVLDCCRDNPLTRGWTRSTTRGLAPVQDVPEGMIVAFSTAANTTALDGEGANSPFTAHLVKVLSSRPTEGLEIQNLFREVGRAVKKDIDQRPYLELDATMDNYFLDRDATAEAAPVAVVDPQLPPVAAAPSVRLTLPPAPTPQAAVTMPPATVVTPSPSGTPQPPTQVVFVTPPGVTNTLSGVFANGPYAAFNSYSQGQILRKVQEKMQSAGLYKSKIDGGMGPGTQTAINAWQQANGLTVTGLLDQATLQHMMLLGLAEQNPPARNANSSSSTSGRTKSRSREGDDGDRPSSGGGREWMKWIRPGVPSGPRFGPF